MNGPTRPKFFSLAQVQSGADGHRLLLDGKPVKTPKGRALILPSAALAEALAGEWNALEERIDPAALPLTRLTNTVLDGTAENRGLMLEDLARFAGSDLLCYRAEEPEALIAREAAAWDPLLTWAKDELGASLHVTAGIIHRLQAPEAIRALTEVAAGLDDFALTGLHMATGLTGSLVLGLALLKGRVNAAEAWAAATVDEAFQAELWGVDEEAKARTDRLARELAVAEGFMRLAA